MWAQLKRLSFFLQQCPFLSSISSCIIGSSLSSHIFLLVDFTSWIYYVQNPSAYSMTYPIAMLPSSRAMFLTYLYKAFIYLSMGYIHLVWTGPQRSSSSIRCVMMSKHVGGKTFSRVDIVFSTSIHKTSMVLGSKFIEHLTQGDKNHSYFFLHQVMKAKR